MDKTELLTFDNIKDLGFEYNYYEGWTYQHNRGFSISVTDVNTVWYKGKKTICKTIGDFINLENEL